MQRRQMCLANMCEGYLSVYVVGGLIVIAALFQRKKLHWSHVILLKSATDPLLFTLTFLLLGITE